jgi:hypothetical protein
MVAVAAVGLTVGLIFPDSAGASTWTLSGSGHSTVGGFDFANVTVSLADPNGVATTTTAGGLPLIVTRTATTFTLGSTFSSFDGECLAVGSFAGTAPIVVSGTSATATGTLTGGGVDQCDDGDTPFTISGTFTATSPNAGESLPPVATVATASGTVRLRTPLETQPVAPGISVAPGALLETGGDGAVTFDLTGGVRVSAASNTQVTVSQPSAAELVLNQVTGELSHSRPGGASPDGFRVQTGTALVRPTGTVFSTRYTQSGTQGETVVTVQSGTAEVEDRRGQRTALAAGQSAAFADAVPRVLLILPVDGGVVREGVVNTFAWTAFPGAAGYLFEYKLDLPGQPPGFLVRNATALENPRLGILLFPMPPLLTQTGQTVEFRLPMPAGLAPRGSRGHWRVFPVNALGQILPGSTASDGAAETIQ